MSVWPEAARRKPFRYVPATGPSPGIDRGPLAKANTNGATAASPACQSNPAQFDPNLRPKARPTLPLTRRREVTALQEAMQERAVDHAVIVTRSEDETLHTKAGLIRVLPAWRYLLDQPLD